MHTVLYDYRWGNLHSKWTEIVSRLHTRMRLAVSGYCLVIFQPCMHTHTCTCYTNNSSLQSMFDNVINTQLELCHKDTNDVLKKSEFRGWIYYTCKWVHLSVWYHHGDPTCSNIVVTYTDWIQGRDVLKVYFCTISVTQYGCSHASNSAQ